MIAPVLVNPPTAVLRMGPGRYHSLPQTSRSQINDFLDSRWGFYQQHEVHNPLYQFIPTTDTLLGEWWHELILERNADISKMGLRVIPDDVLNDAGHRIGKKYNDWKNQHCGEDLLTAAEYAERIEMLNAIKRNMMANALLIESQDDSDNEVTLVWKDVATNTGLRARLDRIISRHAIVDLKTIATADVWSVRRAIRERRYDIQGGMYQEGHFQTSGERLPFVLVFIEKNCPWRCVVRQIPQKGLDLGWRAVQQALIEIQECRQSGDWRDIETKSDEVPLADDPLWEET